VSGAAGQLAGKRHFYNGSHLIQGGDLIIAGIPRSFDLI
jgi:hypothetical protein